MTASGVAGNGEVVLGNVVIRLRDLGPEPAWHEDRTLFAPWFRFEAELPSYPVVRERGTTPWEAVYRLVGMHRAVLERRWSSGGFDAPGPGSGGLGPSAASGRARGSRP